MPIKTAAAPLTVEDETKVTEAPLPATHMDEMKAMFEAMRRELAESRAQTAKLQDQVTELQRKAEPEPEPEPVPIEKQYTTIAGVQVEICPQTGRPMPGSIVNGRKTPWTAADIKAIYGSVHWYNFTGLSSVTVNGVTWPIGGGEIDTPSIVRDVALDCYHRGQGQHSFVQPATGPLEKIR